MGGGPPARKAAGLPAVPVTVPQELLAGSLAGVADAFATHPIDQVKTQFHVNATKNPALSASLLQQYRAGGVGRLYRGVFAACLRPQALCMYSGNEVAKRLVAGKDGALTPFTAPLAGAMTGLPESMCVTPFEVVKVRMQSLEHVGRFRTELDCVRHLLNTEGVGAIYNGFSATLARNVCFNGFYFGALFWLKESMPPMESAAAESVANLGVGMAAGAFATVFKMPFDVCKSRMQNQIPRPDGGLDYPSLPQALVKIAREEGPAGLYKGWGPTMGRCMLGMSVGFFAFELALDAIVEGRRESRRQGGR